MPTDSAKDPAADLTSFVVGGAVRDRLLGLPVKDRDHVVVGSDPAQMKQLGFKQVGADFPVFIHPRSGEEYALARTERKTGPGYHGFVVHAAPDVTLEQDLARRDLTINAMAESPDGALVDPFNGQQDLQRRLLRHVSPAFSEDPVRILRVARFAARLAPLGFSVAPQTRELMARMVASGEVAALVPERVWQELSRALGEPAPQAFVSVLRDCGALSVVLPEVDRLFGVPQPANFHPEVDTGLHLLLVLAQAAGLSDDARVRFAALTHDLGKGATPAQYWPSHHGHEARGARLAAQLCDRLRAPRAWRELAVAVARYHGLCHRAATLRPATLLKLLEGIDALRRPERLEPFLLACEADHRGRTGFEQRPYPQAALLRAAHAAASGVRAATLAPPNTPGQEIARLLKKARIDAIASLDRSQWV